MLFCTGLKIHIMKKYILLFVLLLSGIMVVGQAYPDRHSTSWKDAWISCQETESPNIKRDPGHWIMYDFGAQYALQESTIWNFNVPDTTNRGVNDIVVDYSSDGETWIEVMEFSVPEAPGSAFYQGVAGPDFEGIVARYVLVSILNTHGDASCAALSEIRINATISTSTSIAGNELDIDLEVSPNPASDYTMISIKKMKDDLHYSLTDVNGRLIRQGDVNNLTWRMNTSALSSGIYSLSLFDNTGSKTILINVIK